MTSLPRANDVVVVLGTAPAAPSPGSRSAAELARALLEERLCACVSVVPGVVSHYWWNGALDESSECLLVIKTSAACVGALRKRLVELHPYEVPEVLELPVASGHEPYLRWVLGEVRGAGGGVDG